MRKKNDFSMLTLVAGGKKFGSNKLPVKKNPAYQGRGSREKWPDRPSLDRSCWYKELLNT